MRKTTMLGLSTIALCLGFLLGAAGNIGHGHGAIKAAHADTKGGTGGGGVCPNGSQPSCAVCTINNVCLTTCAGGLFCSVTYNDYETPVACETSNTYCLSGATSIRGPGSPPIGIGR